MPLRQALTHLHLEPPVVFSTQSLLHPMVLPLLQMRPRPNQVSVRPLTQFSVKKLLKQSLPKLPRLLACLEQQTKLKRPRWGLLLPRLLSLDFSPQLMLNLREALARPKLPACLVLLRKSQKNQKLLMPNRPVDFLLLKLLMQSLPLPHLEVLQPLKPSLLPLCLVALLLQMLNLLPACS